MTIKSKFEVGDTVFTLQSNVVIQDTIRVIYFPQITTRNWEPRISYGLTRSQLMRDEYQLGATKEELLSNL